jgi:hypothetical protein
MSQNHAIKEEIPEKSVDDGGGFDRVSSFRGAHVPKKGNMQRKVLMAVERFTEAYQRPLSHLLSSPWSFCYSKE